MALARGGCSQAIPGWFMGILVKVAGEVSGEPGILLQCELHGMVLKLDGWMHRGQGDAS